METKMDGAASEGTAQRLVRYVNRARTNRLIKSRMGQKIIGMSFCYGYDLVHDECTPKELVFRKGNSTVRWS